MSKLSALKKRNNQARFNRLVPQIRHTKPVTKDTMCFPRLAVVTQLYHNAVDMYLLAIKSYFRNFSADEVHILDDGSLTESDKVLLREQVEGVLIIPIKDVDLGNCPSGGTWERLVYICRLREQKYVVQLDSDVVITGAMPEVYNAYKHNNSFTIGGPMWPERVDPKYMSYVANNWKPTHVQPVSEGVMADIMPADFGYLRGCSAFCGFSRSGGSFAQLEELAQKFVSILGVKKWAEWGSEQFSSSLIISLEDNSSVLPWPKYQNFGFPKLTTFDEVLGQVSAIHFIGSNRYDRRVYEKALENQLARS